MSERKTRKRPQYSIEQKNGMVKAYLCQEIRLSEIIRRYDIDKSSFLLWLKQYRQFGTAVDGRGRATKNQSPQKGRPKRTDYESMTKEELIEYIRVGEEIKKAVAYLRKQKKNIAS